MEVISSPLSISNPSPRSSAKRHQTAASGRPSTHRRILSITAQQLPTPALKRSLKPSQTLYPPSQQSSTTTATTTSTASPTPPPLKKVFLVTLSYYVVLVPIGYGTEEMEAVILIDVLRRAGAEVFVASVESQLEIEAAGGTRLVADVSISDCLDQIFDLVALPGGMPGSARLRDCEALKKITSKQAEEKRLYGAICAAPAIALLPWGLLKHKWTTCHPAFFNRLPTFWAVKSNNIVSEELTTSRGPGTAFDFALSFTEQLFGESITKEIRDFFLLPTDVVDGALRKEEFNEVEWPVCHTPQVLVPVANGSEVIEVVTVTDVLRRAKVDVVVASVEKSVLILASRGTKIVADKSIVSAAESVYDMIILPGGAIGAGRLHKSEVLKRLLKEQEAAGRLYGAICPSPSILHKQGLLKDKKAAAHPSVTRKLTDHVVDGVGVVIDGKVITSRGLSTVTDFALAVVSKLFGPARARCVAEGLVFEYPKN